LPKNIVSREKLVEYCRDLANKGYAPASGGNASIRTPEGVWITAGGSVLGSLSTEDLVLVDQDGKKLDGQGNPSKEVLLHLAVYQANAKVNVTLHFHPPQTIGACALVEDGNNPIPAFVPTFIMRVHGSKLLPYYHPGSFELSQQVQRYAADYQVILLRNHGLVSSGETLTKAAQAVEETEENARIYLLTGGAGRALSEESCRELREKYWSRG